MKQHYDIVIMGAGMVGSSFAVAMLERAKSLDLSIALIEPNALQTDPTLENQQASFDSRATALSYGSAIIYQQLSVWDELQRHVQAISKIHVSDKGHFGAARLSAEQENVAALGYVVENKWLGDVLYRHLAESEQAKKLDFCCPASVEKIERIDGLMHLQVKCRQTEYQVTTQLVVMADGGRSKLREKLGISYSETHYQQHALVANLAVDRAHQNVAYERFSDTGPIALLPLLTKQRQHRCGLIWTIPEQEIEQVLGLSDKEFLARLQQRFGYRAGRFTSVGTRVSYPLKLQTAQEQVRAGLVIVGNAAHTLHPIAGQGFNLALRGVVELAQQLVTAAQHAQNLGDYNMLYDYQQSRLADQRATIGFSDKSMRLFSTSNPIIALGRDAGLQLLDICPAAKTIFSRSAMGLTSPMSLLD